MYIILNKDLKFNEKTDLNKEYQVYTDKISSEIVADSFIEVLEGSILRNHYKLGESIYVYGIDGLSLNITDNDNDRIYTFKVKKEVPYSMLKKGSSNKNNWFRVYRFVLILDDSLKKDKFIDYLLELSGFCDWKVLMIILEYLQACKYKYQKYIETINEGLDILEKNIICKSFLDENFDLATFKPLCKNTSDNVDIIVSRVNNYIYSNQTCKKDLFVISDFIKSLTNQFYAEELASHYMNKMLIIFSTLSNKEGKDTLETYYNEASTVLDFLKRNNYNYYDSEYKLHKLAILLKNYKKIA